MKSSVFKGALLAVGTAILQLAPKFIDQSKFIEACICIGIAFALFIISVYLQEKQAEERAFKRFLRYLRKQYDEGT